MVDNAELNAGTGGKFAATKQVTHAGDTAEIQVVHLVGISGAEGSYVFADIDGTAANGLEVDVTRISGTVVVDGSAVTQPVSHGALTELEAALNSSRLDVNIAIDNAGLATNAAQLPDGHTVVADAGTGDFLSVTGHTLNESFKESSAIGGQLDDAGTTLATEDNVAPVRITARRGLHVNLRDNSGGELGVTATPIRTDPTGTTTQPVSGTVSVTGVATAAGQLVNGHDVTIDNASIAVTIAQDVMLGTDFSNVLGAASLVQAADQSDGLLNSLDTLLTTNFNMVFNGATWDRVLEGAIAGSVLIDGTVVASQTGTWNVNDLSGKVSLPTGAATLAAQLGDGHNVTVDNAAGTNPVPTEGDAAHDAPSTGNPVLLGAQMETQADSAPGTRSDTDGDATTLAASDGALYTIPTGPQTWDFHIDGSSALTDQAVHASPGAGLSLYIQTIVFSSGAATAINMFFEEGGTTVLGPYYLEAVAGRGLVVNFLSPKKITAATALTVTTSAAILHPIDVTGFIGPG